MNVNRVLLFALVTTAFAAYGQNNYYEDYEDYEDDDYGYEGGRRSSHHGGYGRGRQSSYYGDDLFGETYGRSNYSYEERVCIKDCVEDEMEKLEKEYRKEAAEDEAKAKKEENAEKVEKGGNENKGAEAQKHGGKDRDGHDLKFGDTVEIYRVEKKFWPFDYSSYNGKTGIFKGRDKKKDSYIIDVNGKDVSFNSSNLLYKDGLVPQYDVVEAFDLKNELETFNGRQGIYQGPHPNQLGLSGVLFEKEKELQYIHIFNLRKVKEDNDEGEKQRASKEPEKKAGEKAEAQKNGHEAGKEEKEKNLKNIEKGLENLKKTNKTNVLNAPFHKWKQNFQDEQAADNENLQVGMMVTTADLDTKTYNGKRGTITGKTESGRWKVKLTDPEKEMAFKPNNLVPIFKEWDQAEICGFDERDAKNFYLNGKTCYLRRWLERSTTSEGKAGWIVSFHQKIDRVKNGYNRPDAIFWLDDMTAIVEQEYLKKVEAGSEEAGNKQKNIQKKLEKLYKVDKTNVNSPFHKWKQAADVPLKEGDYVQISAKGKFNDKKFGVVKEIKKTDGGTKYFVNVDGKLSQEPRKDLQFVRKMNLEAGEKHSGKYVRFEKDLSGLYELKYWNKDKGDKGEWEDFNEDKFFECDSYSDYFDCANTDEKEKTKIIQQESVRDITDEKNDDNAEVSDLQEGDRVEIFGFDDDRSYLNEKKGIVQELIVTEENEGLPVRLEGIGTEYVPRKNLRKENNDRRRLSSSSVQIPRSEKLKIEMQCQKKCTGMKVRIRQHIEDRVEKRFGEVIDKTLDEAGEGITDVTTAAINKAKASFASKTHFSQYYRPFGLILQNHGDSRAAIEYRGFDPLSGGQQLYKNVSRSKKNRNDAARSDAADAALIDEDDEEEDEDDTTEKIEPGETAVVKFADTAFLQGVSGTVKMFVAQAKRELHVYISNPLVGAYKCCMELVQRGESMNTENCHDDNTHSIPFGKMDERMKIYKTSRYESFEGKDGTKNRVRMCRIVVLPETADAAPPIPSFY